MREREREIEGKKREIEGEGGEGRGDEEVGKVGTKRMKSHWGRKKERKS